MSSTINAIEVPGYVAGKWTIDRVHSDVSFKVRHLGVANIRGKFHGVVGVIVLAENPLESSVLAEIDLASIDTGNEGGGDSRIAGQMLEGDDLRPHCGIRPAAHSAEGLGRTCPALSAWSCAARGDGSMCPIPTPRRFRRVPGSSGLARGPARRDPRHGEGTTNEEERSWR